MANNFYEGPGGRPDNDGEERFFPSESSAPSSPEKKESDPLLDMMADADAALPDPEQEPESPEEPEEETWSAPLLVVPEPVYPAETEEKSEEKKPRRCHRGGRGRGKGEEAQTVQQPEKKLEKPHEEKKGEKLARGERHGRKPNADKQATVKPVRVEPKAGEEGRSAEKSGEKPHRSNRRRHYRKPKPKTGGENG